MRENKTLAAIIVVMVVGSLGLAAALFTSYSSYTTTLEEYQTVSDSVANAKGAKLFPSEENVLAKEAAVIEYEESVGSLSTVLMALQQPVKPLTDTEFQARLKTRISEVRQMAQGRTDLPKDFAFGFDSYTSALPRSGEAASELGDYLAAVDAIVTMIIESGAKSIDSLSRTELQIEKGTPPPPPEPPKEVKKATTARSKKSKQTAKKAPPPKEIAKVVERRQVTLTMTADQGPLQFIMNKLASPSQMVHFTIVRQLRVDNEQQEGPLRGSLKRLVPSSSQGGEESKPSSDAAASGSAQSSEGQASAPSAPGGASVAAPATPKVIEPAKASAPDAQAVFGEESLKVYMEIDLVRFLEPKS